MITSLIKVYNKAKRQIIGKQLVPSLTVDMATEWMIDHTHTNNMLKTEQDATTA